MTTIAPLLSVRNGAKAINFYKAAFGAGELYRIDDPGSGAVVAQLSVGTADFWVADESPEHQNFSPESLGGGSVRMVMTGKIRMAPSIGLSQQEPPSCGLSATNMDGA